MSGEERAAYDLIDQVARKSDRWWFFALLVIGMFTVGYLIHYFQQQLALRDVKIEALHESIETKLTSALTENTRAMDRNTTALERAGFTSTR